MAGKPKTPFFIAVFAVVCGLIVFALWRGGVIGGGDVRDADVDNAPLQVDIQTQQQLEDPSTAGITTVQEYDIVPQESLIPVQGTSDYKPLEDNTVRFALNVWAGWAPIIYANNGAQAGKVWKTPDGEEFKVQLVLIDNPTQMLDNYVAGEVHIGWATVDMLPLFMERLVDDTGTPLDSRVMPRIFQQVDWSNGGDGIVVRENIKQVSDLRGKTITLAQNSPSHYFALNMLVAGGVQPHEVNFKFTGDAFQAAALFASDKSISACVSWAPDIYKLAESKGNRMLVDTATANRMIADVWFARADFAKDHPGIIEGLVRGIFDSMDELSDQEAKKKGAQLMADVYNIPATETIEMFADAYSTRWGDNYQFFVNSNYLANFERVWNNAYYLYGNIRVLKKPRVKFSKVVDYSVIKKLGEEDQYAQQVVQSAVFAPRRIDEGEVAEKAFLTATHYIHFFPNNSEVSKTVTRKVDGKDVEEQYDPNIDFVLDKIGEQIGQFELSRVVIEGHADGSMKGQVDEDLVLELSQNRANAVSRALVDKFEQLDPNRFQSVGVGWRRPADPERPNDHALNRRVEIRILPAEGQ
jgi:ABC-type nitrate/sulfonate/bicarbonate transport system substrate-binding protein/outer membrane protein OmpA-like peptidoglycan-associated protein